MKGMQYKYIFKENKAVSTVVGVLLVLSLVITSVSTILLFGIPYIEERNANLEHSSVSNQIDIVRSTHNELVDSNLGSTKENNVAIESGSLSLADTDEDRLVVMYADDGYNFDVSGLGDGDDNFILEMIDGEITETKIHWYGTKTPYSMIKPTGVSPIDESEEAGVFYDTNTYDFSNSDNKAYGTDQGEWLCPLDPGNDNYQEYDEIKYSKIRTEDNYNIWYGDYEKYVNLYYQFKIDENPSKIYSIVFNWSGYDDLIHGGNFSFHIWNFTSDSWEEEKRIPAPYESKQNYFVLKSIGGYNPDPDFTDHYIDGSGNVIFGLCGSEGTDKSESITVEYPSNPEIFYRGNSYNVLWSSKNVTGNVKIELIQLSDEELEKFKIDGGGIRGESTKVLFANTENDGEELWYVEPEEHTGSNFIINVSSINNQSVFDYSDNEFTITDLDTVPGETCSDTCSGSTCEGTCPDDYTCFNPTCFGDTCTDTCRDTCGDLTCLDTCTNTCFTCNGCIDETLQDTCPATQCACCFPEGTKISMADGSLKNIENIVVGDRVLSFDVENNVFVESVVSDFIVKVREGVYSINDGIIMPTDDHPFYVKKSDGITAWASINPDKSKVMYNDRDAVSLEVGDSLFTGDSWVDIESIVFCPGELVTYTFAVDSVFHDYFANGILVSNCIGCTSGETCMTCSGNTCDSTCTATCSNTCDCPSPNCCFPEGTKISMADGSLKNIENIVVGDRVLSFDVENNVFVESVVSDFIVKVREGVYSINDGIIMPTDDHPFYVKKSDGITAWASINPDKSKVMYNDRDAVSLEVGDSLFTGDSWVDIESIVFCPGELVTYTFAVDSVFHDYFANGILVSNGAAEGCIVTGGGEGGPSLATAPLDDYAKDLLYDTDWGISFSNGFYGAAPSYDNNCLDSPIYNYKTVLSISGNINQPDISFLGGSNFDDVLEHHFTMYEYYVKLDVIYYVNDSVRPSSNITIAPDKTTTDTSISFTWNGSDDKTNYTDLVYKYRLDPYQTSWQPGQDSWTSSTSVTYNDLAYGDYAFRVRARDLAGNIETSETINNTYSFSIVEPTQTFDNSTNPINAGDNIDFVVDYSISNFTHIEFFNDEDAIGGIYVFDFVPLSWELSSSSGMYSVYMENDAIFSSSGNNIYVMTKKPDGIYTNDGSFIFHVVQTVVSSDSAISSSGSGSLSLVSRLVENRVLEDSDIGMLKVQNFGKFSDVWNDYYSEVHGFSSSDGITLTYPNPENLLLMRSVIEVNMKNG